jgi:mannose-6-phosphate isomerase-like protein (cupin superfamily)
MLLIYDNPETREAFFSEGGDEVMGEVDALMKELAESGETALPRGPCRPAGGRPARPHYSGRDRPLGTARKEGDLNAGPEEKSRRTEESNVVRILNKTDLAHGETSYEFEGRQHGHTNVSVIVIDAPPGSGPKLHRHPYEEVFVVQEGSVTFTAGGDVIEASGGQVVVVPTGVPHKFVNSGAGRLRQVDIHASGRFVTEWLEE